MSVAEGIVIAMMWQRYRWWSCRTALMGVGERRSPACHVEDTMIPTSCRLICGRHLSLLRLSLLRRCMLQRRQASSGPVETMRWTAMNRYGDRARKYGRDFRPTAYSQIPDPAEFFTDLSKTVEAQVMDLEDRIAGPDEPGEGYLGKVGRLNVAKLQAEEKIMADLVYLPAEIDPEWDEDEEETSGGRMNRILSELREDLQGLDQEVAHHSDLESDVDYLYRTAEKGSLTLPEPTLTEQELKDIPLEALEQLSTQLWRLLREKELLPPPPPGSTPTV